MSVPLPPGAGIENIDPEQIKTVSIHYHIFYTVYS